MKGTYTTKIKHSFIIFAALFCSILDISASPGTPKKKLIIITCMDTRINPYEILNLNKGDAHILRNAGGVITPDIIRSAVLSTHVFDSNKIIVIQHTDCGVIGLDNTKIKQELSKNFNARIPKQFYGFPDLEKSVRQGIQNIKLHPWIDNSKVRVEGAILDINTGELKLVQ